MKPSTRLLALAVALAAAVSCPALAASAPKSPKGAERSASIHAILITASNTKGGVDRRLEPYAANLKRTLPFDTFRFAAEDRTALPSGGRATVTFAGNHRIEIEDDPGAGLRLKVYWLKGPEEIIRTTLTLNPGVPAVLVRRGAGEGDVPVVLLIAR